MQPEKRNGTTGLIFALLLALVGAAAGAAPTPARIALKGTVARGLDTLTGSGPVYHVELLVRNVGAAPLAFDVAEGAWLNAAGKGLHARSTRKGKMWRLDQGDSAAFDFDTDGYTGQLLRDANGGPLFFFLTLYSQGKMVGVPFRALLPPLSQAPDDAAIRAAEREGGSVRVLYLRFVAGRPVPARSPTAPPAKRAAREPSGATARLCSPPVRPCWIRPAKPDGTGFHRA